MKLNSNEKLIEELVRERYLKTPSIIEAFRKIDRADFVPAEHKSRAYVNAPLSIGEGQTISQPLTVAFMLELLEPKEGEKILDIGAGSGWTAALLAEIVGDEGRITAIERVAGLKSFAEGNISKYEFIERGTVELLQGNGVRGYKKNSPYDKIVAAASAGRIPIAWKSQLKVDGKIVAPIRSSIISLHKIDRKNFEKKEYFGFAFVPLVGG